METHSNRQRPVANGNLATTTTAAAVGDVIGGDGHVARSAHVARVPRALRRETARVERDDDDDDAEVGGRGGRQALHALVHRFAPLAADQLHVLHSPIHVPARPTESLSFLGDALVAERTRSVSTCARRRSSVGSTRSTAVASWRSTAPTSPRGGAARPAGRWCGVWRSTC